MTLKFFGFVEVERLSRYMFMQNFTKLNAAVHELSCAQRKKTLTKTILSVATADSKTCQIRDYVKWVLFSLR